MTPIQQEDFQSKHEENIKLAIESDERNQCRQRATRVVRRENIRENELFNLKDLDSEHEILLFLVISRPDMLIRDNDYTERALGLAPFQQLKPYGT